MITKLHYKNLATVQNFKLFHVKRENNFSLFHCVIFTGVFRNFDLMSCS